MDLVLRRWEHGVLAMFFVFAAAHASAAAAPGPELRAELGIGGWVVPGRFAPLRVEVRAAGALEGVLEIEVRGPAGERTLHASTLVLPASGRREFVSDILIVDPRRDVVVRLRTGRDQVQVTVPVGVARAAEGVVAAVTDDAAGLEFLAASEGRIRTAYLVPRALPTSWQAYAAVDLLAVRDLAARALLPSQQEALLAWLAQGGRLLISPGGVPPPGWLQSILPAEMVFPALVVPEIPTPVVRLRPRAAAEVFEVSGTPLVARGAFGRGVVEVWAFDPFSPAGRAWSGRLPLWHALLAAKGPTPIAAAALADELPKSRPLSGRTQLLLAGLSVGYIAAVRILLRRFGTALLGWAGIVLVVAVSSSVLYGSAVGARRAAGSIAQLSIVEGLEGTGRALVQTVVSLISPYGGSVDLVLPDGAAVRTLGPAELQIVDRVALTGAAMRAGSTLLEVSQIIPLDLRADAVEREGTLEIRVTGRSDLPAPAILYRVGHLYRLEAMPGGRAVLDPARWEPAGRAAGFGPELAARASEALLKLLDGGGGEMYLVGLIQDDAVGVALRGGGPGQRAQLVVLPVELRR